MCMCAKSLQLCPTLWDPIWPRNYIIWYLPKTGEILCWTCTWMFIAALFIIPQKLETINMSFSKWVNKKIVVFLNNGILLSVKRSIKPQNDTHVNAQSCLTLLLVPWTVARQAPLSMGFSRQEYWSGLPFPPPGDLLDPGIEPVSPVSPALQADSLPWTIREALLCNMSKHNSTYSFCVRKWESHPFHYRPNWIKQNDN